VDNNVGEVFRITKDLLGVHCSATHLH